MNNQRLKAQVETIRQTFSYINRFKGQLFVIKIGDALINHPLFPMVIKDLVFLHQVGIRILIVPGARSRIDEVLSTFKIKSHSHNGIRISTEKAIPFIKMAATDVCNRVMTLLAENNTYAVIGNWVKARGIGVRDGVDYESSGLVEKLQVDIIRNTLEQGLIPIFPCIGWNAKGKPYNISSDELAFSLSREMAASKLFFITGSAEVSAKKFTTPQGAVVGEDGIVNQMTVDEAGMFIDLNADRKSEETVEMVALGYKACREGVQRVHIVDGRVEGMILKEIFTNQGLGTMIYANQLDNIRPMEYADIPEMLGIMQPLVEEGILVQRTAEDLEQKREDYVVYEVDGTIHGCGALHAFADKSGEIAAVAVDESYEKRSIGKKLVTFLIERAAGMKLKRIFVLTTQTSDWFAQMGFVEGAIEDLPEEKRKIYNTKRNSRILVYAVSKNRLKRGLNVE
jgi:amino-acid N-acetyltransferase